MKKITILSIAIIALSFASCKKDRTCTCSTTVNGADAGTVTVVYKKVSKKSGTAACTSAQTTPDGSAYPEIKTCTLN